MTIMWVLPRVRPYPCVHTRVLMMFGAGRGVRVRCRSAGALLYVVCRRLLVFVAWYVCMVPF